MQWSAGRVEIADGVLPDDRIRGQAGLQLLKRVVQKSNGETEHGNELQILLEQLILYFY